MFHLIEITTACGRQFLPRRADNERLIESIWQGLFPNLYRNFR